MLGSTQRPFANRRRGRTSRIAVLAVHGIGSSLGLSRFGGRLGVSEVAALAHQSRVLQRVRRHTMSADIRQQPNREERTKLLGGVTSTSASASGSGAAFVSAADFCAARARVNNARRPVHCNHQAYCSSCRGLLLVHFESVAQLGHAPDELTDLALIADAQGLRATSSVMPGTKGHSTAAAHLDRFAV